MLPAANRMRRPTDFAQVIRHGRRVAAGALVVHVLTSPTDAPTRVGFVVSRAVGGAVVRNTLRRRLRHICQAQIVSGQPAGVAGGPPRVAGVPVPAGGPLPAAGVQLVVRALPAAAGRPSNWLRADLDRGLARAIGGSP